ncbi:MAG: BMP family lipoprotein [Anaerolineae bacterium]
MSHKKISMLLAVLLITALLAGCAQPQPTPTPAPQPTKAEATAAPQPTTPPPTAPPAKKYKVALVCGLLGDRSFLDSAARGIQWAQERLPNVETKIVENADVSEQQLAARAMAEQGYDLVITIGYGSADWTTEIANAYPDTRFALVDAALKCPNCTGLIFREHDGSFTVGMVAAMLTKTGKVGYVGGMDVPLLRRFEQGYIQGVKYVNPNIEVVSGWVGAFNDPTKGKELALTQYQEGVDIIYAAAGKSGEGVIAASKEQGKFSIGVDSDQCYIAPGNVICSMMKMVDVAVFDAIKSLTEGKLEPGNRVYGLQEDAVGMCYLYGIDTYFLDNGPKDMAEKMKNEVIPAVKKAVEKIKAGEFCVVDAMGVYPCDKPAPEGGMGQ